MKERRLATDLQDRLSEFGGPALSIVVHAGGVMTVGAVNAAFLDETGYRSDMLLGVPLPGLLGPGCQILLDLAGKTQETGRPADGVIGLITPKGPRRYHVVLLPGAAKSAAADELIVISTDITTSEAVRYLDEVLISVKDVIWSLLIGAKVFNYVSQSVETLIGATPEELMTVPAAWYGYIHPEDVERVKAAWKAAQDGSVFDLEYRMQHRDGRMIWVRDRGTMVRDQQGRPLRIDGITQDITAIRTAEAKARAVEALYRTVVENQVELICRYKPDLTFVFCNEAYAALYGRTAAEMIGTSMLDIVDESEQEEIRGVVDRLLAGQPISHNEQPKKFSDGRIAWYSWSDVAIYDHDGHITEIQGIGRDVTARRQMERDLQASEQRLRLAIDSIPDAFALYDKDDRLVLCNKQYFKLAIAPTTENPVGQTFEELARALATAPNAPVEAKTDPEGWVEKRLQRHRDPPSHPVEIPLQDGRLLRVSERRTPDGGWVATWSDITALKEAEQSLRTAIESMPDSFALFDPDDNLTICNSSFLRDCRKAGIDDPIGRPARELFTAFSQSPNRVMDAVGDPDKWVAERMELHRNPPDAPIDRQWEDGSWMRVVERRTANGGYVGVWSDITPLKEAETRLRSAIAAFNEGFVFYDRNERLVLCNARFKELYPKSAPSMVPGATLEAVFRHGMAHGEFPDMGKDPEAWLQKELKRARLRESNMFERLLEDGRWLLVSRSPLPDGGFVSIITDLSQLKLREAELEEAQKKLQQQTQNLTQLAEQLRSARITAESASQAKSRFLAHMSHELRTPLNAILGFADVIRHQMFGEISPSRYQDYVQYIHESGSHLLEMINDVLDLSKIEAGKFDLKPQSLDAAEIAQAGSKLVAGMAKENSVHLIIDIDPDCPVIHGDARAVKQIIINLLSNGVKFTQQGGYVTLQINGIEKLGCEIVVTDTGIGMSKEDIAKALDPFGQIDGTLARKHRGTGLGLPLVKNLAELQGGSLNIDSAPSRGTRVTVFLPLQANLSMDTPDFKEA